MVQAVVLNIDPQNERVSLGIKQLQPDPWSEIPRTYPIGTKIRGKVSSVTDFGVFLEIEEGIEGLIHISELSHEKLASTKDFAKPGDELDAVVLSIDTVDRKIGLSIKSMQDAMDKADLANFMGSQKQATSNLGDLLSQAKTSNEG
jgi:small subunit ribosomal protein S1